MVKWNQSKQTAKQSNNSMSQEGHVGAFQSNPGTWGCIHTVSGSQPEDTNSQDSRLSSTQASWAPAAQGQPYKVQAQGSSGTQGGVCTMADDISYCHGLSPPFETFPTLQSETFST